MQTLLTPLIPSIVALIIALYGKRMERWRNSPNLKIKGIIPNVQALHNSNTNHNVWRLLVENDKGKDTAREVEIHVIEIERNGNKVVNFLPVPLQWTH